jgi:2-polyprenyl-3-methyl-5-hydroxy-6-metoxy-1,4-benzoquinol methylase
MEHQEIYESIKQYVAQNYAEPFSLLELGCGDASSSSHALEGTAIQTYTGIDIALTGLELAKQNLDRLNCYVELKQQEMQEFFQECSSSFDLILISFVLHHLAAVEKQFFYSSVGNISILVEHCS